MQRTRRLIRLAALAAVACLTVMAVAAGSAQAAKKQPRAKIKNVIVMISDGMGYNQLAAADYYEKGRLGRQLYERFPVRTAMSTYSCYGNYDPLQAWGLFSYVTQAPTDSAAAATAMSTGVKTYDAAIGVDVDREPLLHAAERAESLGKATGVVSSVEWSHATPAGFVAHNASRNDYAGIAREMIERSATDVIMGAGNPWFDDNGTALATAKSYKYVGGQSTWDALVAGIAGADADGDGVSDPWTLIQSKAEFQRLARTANAPDRVCGTAQAHTTLQQGRAGDGMAAPFSVPLNTGVPDLATMTRGALNVLDNNRRGFLLMVEGGAVDWASHANQPGRTVEEQVDFNAATAAVAQWVRAKSNWGETLVIVTGDHETGYLWGPGSGADAEGMGVWLPLVNNGAGVQPGMQFNSGDHTNSLIPLFAKGAGARLLRAAAVGRDPVRGAYLDNTDIARVILTNLR